MNPVNRRITYLGNRAPLTVEDQALWVIAPHDDNNRSAFGEQLIAPISPKAAWRFDYGTVPNTRLYTATTANGGTATLSASQLLLQTTANTAGLARLQTQRRLRYLPGMGGLVRFTAAFGTPKTGSSQLIGLGDTTDGFFFGYKGLAFGIIRRRAGVDTFLDASAWNGTAVPIDPLLGNVYQIRYQWLGYGFIRFYILHPTEPNRGFVLVHTILYPNTSALTSILNPTLPLFAEALNAGNNSNITLTTPSALAALEGETGVPFNPLNVYNSFDALAAFADVNNNHLLTIRNKATFGGIANRIPITISSIALARSQAGAPLTTLRLYRNATTAGALVYADVDTNNSPVEASITTTTITSVNAERTYLLSDNTTSIGNLDFETGELVLNPGESLTVGIQDSGVQATTVAATLNWFEAF